MIITLISKKESMKNTNTKTKTKRQKNRMIK